MHALVFFAIVVAFSADGGVNRWTIDGPQGGKPNAFAVDPSNFSIVYAATQKGLFRSADGGQRWTAIPEMIGNAAFNVAVTASDPSKVFVATAYGLYKSSDHGLSWTIASSSGSFYVAVSPSKPAVLYSLSPTGPKASTDGGITFGSTGTGLATAPVTSLRVDPLTPTTVYASLNSNDGVYKSVDSGAHWTAANSGLTHVVYSLEIDPVSASTLYAAGEGGVYKSTDGGGSWSVLSVVDAIGYAYGLAINRTAPSTVLAATAKGLFKSSDGGAHWIALAPPSNVTAVAFTSTDGSSLITSANFSVYRSTDGGITATESVTGFTAFYTQAIAADPHDGSIVYAGGPQGTYRSSDFGKTWSFSTSRQAAALAIDATDSKTLYLLFFTALFRSTDGGITWDSAFSNGLPEGQTSAIATPPGIHARIYAIAGGTIYRRDGEQPWVSLKSGLPAENVRFISFDPANGQSLFAVVPSGLFKSVDGGANWSAGSLPAGLTATGLAVDPFDVRHQFAWSDVSIYVTSDGGVTWTSVDSIYRTGIVFDPIVRGRLYMSGPTALQASGDGGKTWTKFNNGLGPIHGELLVVGPDGTLYTGGVDGGVSVLRFGRREALKR